MNNEELAEYALLLQRMGAISEAQWVLEKIDPLTTPRVFLNIAFCHLNKWEHESARPYLEKYISSDINPYQRLIGKLNLAMVYCVLGTFQESLALTKECQKEAMHANNLRVFANTLELESQIYILSDSPEKAKACLNKASQILKNNKTFDYHYVKKWQAFLSSFEGRDPTFLSHFRENCIKRQDWENLRESDLLMVKVFPNSLQFDHLFFGTPFEGYRQRALRFLKKETPQGNYAWGGETNQVVDIYRGELNGREVLPLGKKIHQLLEILTRDFYQPMKVGEVFSELYPDEHFNIYSSPNKVYQIVSRTMRHIEEEKLPLSIVQNGRGYRLELFPEASLLIPVNRPIVSGYLIFLNHLKEKVPPGTLVSAKEVQDLLGLKSSKVRDILNEGMHRGIVVKSGQGSGTYYEVLK